MTANALLEALKTYSNNSNLKRSIVVGVIGYPNVGKSSVINAITSRRGGHSKACPVGNQAGVTTSLREVKIDNKLKILDSPGICFPSEHKKKSKTCLLYTSNRRTQPKLNDHFVNFGNWPSDNLEIPYPMPLSIYRHRMMFW